MTPGDVVWTAAQELDAHGHPDAGAAARQKGLAWIAHRPEPTRADLLLAVRLLHESGEYQQAADRLQALAPAEDLESLGLAGLLAAAAGDAEAAAGVIEQLEGLQNPYLSGRHLLHVAGIHAALGDRTEAIDTLRRALAAGLPFGVELHALPILRPLASCPAFESLLRPRGIGGGMKDTHTAPGRSSAVLSVVR